jgi:hypothetical protein
MLLGWETLLRGTSWGRACSGSGLATASVRNCGGSNLAACSYHVRRAVRVRSCGTLVLGTAAGWRLRVRQTAWALGWPAEAGTGISGWAGRGLGSVGWAIRGNSGYILKIIGFFCPI